MDTQTSASIGAIAKALAAVAAEVKNPVKDREVEVFSKRTGGKYRFRYATLNAILEALNAPCSKHGISNTFLVEMRGEQSVVSLLIAHESGEWLRSSLPIVEAGTSNQERGSALSYSKRYLISLAYPIAADDDDDANIADGNDHTARDLKPTPKPQAQQAAAPAFAYVGKEHPLAVQQNALKAKAIDAGVDIRPLLAKHTAALGLEPRAYTEQDDRLSKYLAAVDAELIAKEPNK